MVPYTSDRARDKTKATRPVRDVVGVSVVEMDPSGQLYPKVLTMTANRYRKIYETIMYFRAMNPTGFTLMGMPWMFGFSGETAATELAVFRPLPDEPPIDLPTPHDIPELLQQRRAAVYAYVQAATGVDTSGYTQAEQAAPAERPPRPRPPRPRTSWPPTGLPRRRLRRPSRTVRCPGPSCTRR